MREHHVGGPYFDELEHYDVFDSAPAVTLTSDLAAVHHDDRIDGGGRLVYGGHTIGPAFGQATRALPNPVTVLDRESCEHTGPVREGDTLTSELHVEDARPYRSGTAVRLRSIVSAHTATAPERPVLDRRFTGLTA